jgi:hypothetical protein
MLAAKIIAGLMALYGMAGILFAVVFVAWRIHSIDPAASRGTLGFRLIILPGAAVLWPLLLVRWIRSDAV